MTTLVRNPTIPDMTLPKETQATPLNAFLKDVALTETVVLSESSMRMSHRSNRFLATMVPI